MFDIKLITLASMVVVGIMEVIKTFLPEGTGAKAKSVISLVLSVLASVGFGYFLRLDGQTIIASTFGTVGLVQSSYNFVLKLVSSVIERIKGKIEDADIERPLFEKEVEKALNGMLEEKADKKEEK